MKRLLALLLVVVAWLLPALPVSATPAPALPGASTLCLPECAPVVLLGVPGLRWTDVGPATPTLLRLSRESAVGVLSVKAVPPVTCPADGWLTLGAGNRAVAEGVRRDPCGAELPRDTAAQLAANADLREGAEVGALRRAMDRLDEDGACVGAYGPGPQLAVGYDRPSGTRRHALPCVIQLHEAPPVSGQGTGRVERTVEVDRIVADLVEEAGTLLVVGLSEAPGEASAQLHVALAHGPAFEPGALRSASTRRAPYVQLVDVAPTVLDLVGVEPPESMTGQPWQSVGEAPSIGRLTDLAAQARAAKDVTVPFFVLLLAAQLVLLLALWRRRPELAELVALGGTAALGASYLANLLPWWRSPAPLLTLLAIVVVLAALVVGLASRAAMGRGGAALPAGLVCGFVAGVLVLDLVTGAHLQMSSVAGYSPLVAGRFAGIGNVAFGVLAASALLATAVLARRALAVAAVGAVLVVLDGAPSLGSDVGGVLALVPAFAVLALLESGRRVSLLRLAVAAAAGVLVVVAFALLDLSRPAQDRTHLGRFVQDVLDGTAGTVLQRKADAVLGLLFANPVNALLPLLVAVLVYLVARPPAPLELAFAVAPRWRQGLIAVGVASGIGFAVNDSGAAVPALAIVVALPATVAVVLRARRATVEEPALLA